MVKKKNKNKQLMFKNLFAYVDFKDAFSVQRKKIQFVIYALQFDFSHF